MSRDDARNRVTLPDNDPWSGQAGPINAKIIFCDVPVLQASGLTCWDPAELIKRSSA